MSGLAGILSFDAPVTRVDVDGLCAPAAYRGPDGIHTWHSDVVGLGYLSRRTLPPSDIAPQPLAWHDGELAIVFDGRLDGRGDLAARLGGMQPDAALALEGYRRWGHRLAEHLIGDFALIVWDRARRTLYCARDVMGVRPFYYHWSPQRFICGSDIAQILAAPGVARAPNEGMIGEYLANAIVDHRETVYDGVFRLPAAHWLEVAAGVPPIVRRYWRIDVERGLDGRSDGEYADGFRSVFFPAVRDRLRSAAAVGVYFSGGTDSAAVIATAAAVADEASRPAGFTLALDLPEADERTHVEDLARFCRFGSHVHHAAAGDWDPPARGRDVHDFLRDAAVGPWKRAIAAQGCRAMLTGLGGDAGFFGSYYHYAELLRAGRLLALWRQARGDARTPDSDWSAGVLVQYGLWPLLPAMAQRALRPAARRLTGYRVVPSWIDPGYAARIDLESRIRPQARDRRGSSAVRDDLRREFESGWNAVYRETAERESEEHGLEERHPFLDRRVIEFAMALPDDQRWRDDLTRYVVRNGLAGVMSPLSRARTTRGDGSARVAEGIRGMAASGLFTRMAIVDGGWIRQGSVDQMLGRMLKRYAAGDRHYCDDAFPLWMIGGVELWFRKTFAEPI